MKLSLILEAIDRMSAPVKGAERAVEGLGRKGFGGLGDRIDSAKSKLGAFWRDGERGERIGRRLGTRLREIAVGGFAGLGRAADRARAATGGLLRNLGKLALTKGLSIAKWGVVGATGAAGTALGLFARGVIANAAKFEQYQVALEGTEGSAKKAKAAMGWVQDFAKRTPYDIDTVTDAFVRARGVGIDPMTGAFRALGDAAGGSRKSLMDAVEAVADAQTGEFERLKEFNVTTSSKGAGATFSYIDKSGKQASKSVKKSAIEIRAAILDIFEAKYGGGMERQSKTLTGIWSNLQDVLTNFELKVAGAGIFDKVKGGLQQVLEWTDRIASDGRLDKWAQQASGWLGVLWDKAQRFINETDWPKVATNLRDVGTAMWGIARAIGFAVGLVGKLDRFLRGLPQPPAWIGKLDGIARGGLGAAWNWATGGGDAKPASRPGAQAAARPPARRSDAATPAAWRGAVAPRAAPWPRTGGGAIPGGPRAAAQPVAKPGKVAVEIKLTGNAAPQASVRSVAATGNVRATVQRGRAMPNSGPNSGARAA